MRANRFSRWSSDSTASGTIRSLQQFVGRQPVGSGAVDEGGRRARGPVVMTVTALSGPTTRSGKGAGRRRVGARQGEEPSWIGLTNRVRRGSSGRHCCSTRWTTEGSPPGEVAARPADGMRPAEPWDLPRSLYGSVCLAASSLCLCLRGAEVLANPHRGFSWLVYAVGQ
jgi:hypothetical protein